jgi:hypothetical protein
LSLSLEVLFEEFSEDSDFFSSAMGLFASTEALYFDRELLYGASVEPEFEWVGELEPENILPESMDLCSLLPGLL